MQTQLFALLLWWQQPEITKLQSNIPEKECVGYRSPGYSMEFHK